MLNHKSEKKQQYTWSAAMKKKNIILGPLQWIQLQLNVFHCSDTLPSEIKLVLQILNLLLQSLYFLEESVSSFYWLY